MFVERSNVSVPHLPLAMISSAARSGAFFTGVHMASAILASLSAIFWARLPRLYSSEGLAGKSEAAQRDFLTSSVITLAQTVPKSDA